MATKIDIEEFIIQVGKMPLIDVRSPAEFHKGHIPGAINIPLFDNDERKTVGTLYVKKSREVAIQKGFELIAAKYSKLTRAGKEIAEDSALLIYCWRGGMRSSSLAWLYEHLGIKCILLNGGYKSFRRYLRQFFQKKLTLKIVGGMTGSGKTIILKELDKKGEQVIDLEKIAGHKGSAFGSLGETEQPENEHFENLLFMAFQKLDCTKRIWLEDESRNIGKVFIPGELYEQMRKSDVYVIDLEKKRRIEWLVRNYSTYPDNELIQSIVKITKKIGGQNLKIAVEAIQKKDYSKAVEISLFYYDKAYQYGLARREEDTIVRIKGNDLSMELIADLIIQTIDGQ